MYCEVVKGRAGVKNTVVRLSDRKILAVAYDNKHAKAIAKRMNVWNTLGWPPNWEK